MIGLPDSLDKAGFSRTVARTLARIPDDVVLSMATREFDMNYPMQCVCGWAVREMMARGLGFSDAALVDGRNNVDVIIECAVRFGGTHAAWNAIFYGVCHRDFAALVEEAFLQRVDEAVMTAAAV